MRAADAKSAARFFLCARESRADPIHGPDPARAVSVGGFMGLGARLLAVPWSAFTPDAASQRCIADVAHMHLTAVPINKRGSWLERHDATRLGSAIFTRRSGAFGVGD